MSNSIDIQYQNLLKDIIENGVEKDGRNGKTKSVFGRTIRHKMSDGFPLLTTKKMSFKNIVTELLWFLRGDTNIKYLVENGCHIWDGDAYKRYSKIRLSILSCKPPASEDKLREYIEWYEQINSKEQFIERIKTDAEFAKKWGELGPIYGKQWRSWLSYFTYFDKTTNKDEVGACVTDQIANAVHKLKTNPDDRGIIVSAWNVGELNQMVLRPCHNFFQFYTRELTAGERIDLALELGYDSFDLDIAMGNLEDTLTNDYGIPQRAISLMWNQRSVDTPLGLPYNIASYALLLEILAKSVNMIPDELIGNLADTHIYLNQMDGIKEQLDREPFELPKLVHMKTNDFYKSLSEDVSLLQHLQPDDFKVDGYKSHAAIKMPLSN
jgi:thymidylate synthase